MTKIKNTLITARCLGSLTHLDCENCDHKKNPIHLTEIIKGKRIPLTIDRLKKIIFEKEDTKEWAPKCYLQQKVLLHKTAKDTFILLQPVEEPLEFLRIAVMATD
ncbi:hypothetical protein KAK05_03130 [Candidatus Parcubacteria bacterium]|nr:hypothetical protein [Candidatus Parcubacteria bacterium]